MEAKISNAQLEVWEWKKRIYEQGKNLLTSERIQLMKEQTDSLLRYLKQKKQKKGVDKKL